MIIEREVFSKIKPLISSAGAIIITGMRRERVAYELKMKPYEQDITKLKRLCSELKIDKYYVISKEYSPLQAVKYAFTL